MRSMGWGLIIVLFTFLTTGSAGAQAPASSAGIFVADFGRDRIVRMNDMTGTGWRALGIQGNGINQFSTPSSIIVDPAGNIYVADYSNHRIVRMNDMTGAGWTTLGGSLGSGINQVALPTGIFVDAAGKIYVTDIGNARIVRMDDMTGRGWITFGGRGSGIDQFGSLGGIFVDPAGKIYVTDADRDYRFARIVRMDDMTGAGWTTFGARGSGVNQFRSPTSIFVNAAGKIYVTDRFNYRIIRMVPDLRGYLFGCEETNRL